jgi:hypothetical protein
VLQEFELVLLTVRDRDVGSSHVVKEFKFGTLTVENSYRNGRRKIMSSSEAMINQWASQSLGLGNNELLWSVHILRCTKAGKSSGQNCNVTLIVRLGM